MHFILRTLTRWSTNYHERKRARWGVVTDPHRSGWDTDVAGVDLLAKMADEQRRRKAAPRRTEPLP
jgi:hypothetical protein